MAEIRKKKEMFGFGCSSHPTSLFKVFEPQVQPNREQTDVAES